MSIKKLISLSTAARLCPAPSPSPNAIWRWGRKGLKTRNGRRVFLKLFRVGGKLLTTEADLFRFFEEVAEADQEHFASVPVRVPVEGLRGRTTAAIKQAITDANRELDDAGFGEVL